MTAASHSRSEITAFASLMRRYAFAYTASHDFSVCDSIMVDDYVLLMGNHTIRGRDEAYKPATERQYRQYPGLGFTVHDFISNGERAAFRFTEHGHSMLAGTSTSWRGISLYSWDHERLTECRVEQDYCSRSAQGREQRPQPVPPPALDPWHGPYGKEDRALVARIRNWLAAGEWLTEESLEFDDEANVQASRAVIAEPATTVLDIFGAGPAVAFHVRVSGIYLGGMPGSTDAWMGVPATLYATGLVRETPGGFTGQVVTDRLGLARRLQVLADSPGNAQVPGLR